MKSPGFLQRLELLTGTSALELLSNTSVIIFGTGGVGSWCAEGLTRNGVGRITLVDSDMICTTNINRQLQATHETVGASKVEELAKRLKTINPTARIIAQKKPYTRETWEGFDLPDFDYVIDAIDSLGNKVDLIENALAADVTLFSSLGASNKLDPSQVRTGSFWDVRGCPFGKHLRKRLRNRDVSKDFTAVYSSENRARHDIALPCGTGECLCPEVEDNDAVKDWCEKKMQINGSSVQVTATFGFHLTGLVTLDMVDRAKHL